MRAITVGRARHARRPWSVPFPYDHALASALARRGARRRARDVAVRSARHPNPRGPRRELFYPVSSRLFGRSRLRLPVAPRSPWAWLGWRLRTDVLHVQWAPLPADLRCSARWAFGDHRARRPPETLGLEARPLAPPLRPVRPCDRPQGARATPARRRGGRRARPDPRISHPVFPGTTADEDDGRTILFVGVIRPYKQLDHVLEAAAESAPGRLSPAIPLWTSRAGGSCRRRMAARLPRDAAIDDALLRATVAVFAYRPELDQSGALLRALGSGVPGHPYDVGGMAEPVAASAPVRSFPRTTSRRSRKQRGDCSTTPCARQRTRRCTARPPSSPGTPPPQPTWPSTRRSPAEPLGPRFQEVAERQLALFREDQAELLAKVEEALSGPTTVPAATRPRSATASSSTSWTPAAKYSSTCVTPSRSPSTTRRPMNTGSSSTISSEDAPSLRSRSSMKA